MKYIFTLLAVLGLSSTAFADIRVSGQGSVTVTPDTAVITATVTTTGKNMQAAIKFNTEESKAVMTLLRETFRLNESDLCTHGFSAQPDHEYTKEGKPVKITGYTAHNQFIITVKDTSKAGEILGAVGTISKTNSVQINNIQFTVSDTLRNSVLDQARKLAIQDASNRAKVFAEAAGTKVGAVKEIVELNVYIPRMYESGMRALGMADAPNVPVAAGTAKITVGVSMTYGLDK